MQEGCDPATEIAQRLGVPEAAIVLKKRPWHPPRIVEEALGAEEFREMAQLLPTTRAWQKPCVLELPLEPPDAPEFSMGGREICISSACREPQRPIRLVSPIASDDGGACYAINGKHGEVYLSLGGSGQRRRCHYSGSWPSIHTFPERFLNKSTLSIWAEP